MDERKLKNIWLYGIVILLVILSVYLLHKNSEEENNGITENKESYSIVTNYSNFYTVNSCVYRYLTYLQGNDTSSLLKVLNEDFIKSNGINESNLYNYLVRYEGNLNFNSRKMYEEEVNNDITKYYVYGYVEKDVMDSYPERYESYFIVYLDKKNQIFSIQPYSGEIFK